MNNNSQPTLQEQTISSISMMVINILSAEAPRQHIRLYQYIKILAKRLNEKKIEKELDRLYNACPVATGIYLPLSVLNYTYDKDSFVGYGPMKNYQITMEKKADVSRMNIQPVQQLSTHRKKVKKVQIQLGEIIIALDKAKIRMVDLYTQMAIDHNIEISNINPPQLSGESMPSL